MAESWKGTHLPWQSDGAWGKLGNWRCYYFFSIEPSKLVNEENGVVQHREWCECNRDDAIDYGGDNRLGLCKIIFFSLSLQTRNVFDCG